VNSGESGDRAAGPVISRNPLGKYQSHCTGLGGNVQLSVINISGRVRQIHMQSNGLSNYSRTRGSESKQKRQAKKQTWQAHQEPPQTLEPKVKKEERIERGDRSASAAHDIYN